MVPYWFTFIIFLLTIMEPGFKKGIGDWAIIFWLPIGSGFGSTIHFPGPEGLKLAGIGLFFF